MKQELATNFLSPRLPEGYSWSALETAAQRIGTPFYIYCADAAKQTFLRFKEGTNQWGSAEVAYSLKTNPLPALLHDLRNAGACIEAVSAWEVRLAERAGFL